jgi:hypothetical protein
MGLEGGHRLVDETGPDEVEGFAFPGLLLPAVLGQLRGAEAEAEGAEAAAGVDRGQLPVIAHQHHLGLGLLGVLEEAGELAAADHAGLIHHQHRPVAEGLMATVEVAQQPVAGGHLLEPLPLQAHGGDSGRSGRGQEPVAVQLPGMAGDAQGEGLARPGPSHDHRDAGAAPAQISHHRLLIRPGSGMRGQGLAHRPVGSHGRLLPRPAIGALDQPLLDRQQVGVDQRRSSSARSATTLTARSAKNRSASASSSVRPAPNRPTPRATRTSGRAKVDAVAVNPSGPASRSNSRPATAVDTVWSWSRLGVRPVTPRTRASGSTPRSAASVRHRP